MWSTCTREAGEVAVKTKRLKRGKYSELSSSNVFVAVPIETSETISTESLQFLRDLGHRMAGVTEEAKLFQYLPDSLLPSER